MNAFLRLILSLIIVFMMGSALAGPAAPIAPSNALDIIQAALTGAIGKLVSQLQNTAILWLSSFVLVQFLITNLGLLKSGADIEAFFGKLLGSLLWFGFCFYVLENGPEFIQKLGDQFFSSSSGILGGTVFDAGHIMDSGVDIGAKLITTTSSIVGVFNVGAIVIAGVLGVMILLIMAFIALKVFLMKIELALTVMMAPLSFSFLGLNALKDQGIAPFKSIISIIYRLILLGVIISAIDIVQTTALGSLKNAYDNSSWWDKLTTSGSGIWGMLFGIFICYVILGFLAFKSDSIASSLSSGSTSLGSGDAAAAAAAGGAIGSLAGSAAGAAVSPMKNMMNAIRGMSGGNGLSLSNAGGLGSGGPSSPNDAAPQAPKAPSLSKTDIARARENSNTAGVDPGKGEAGSASSTSADSGANGDAKDIAAQDGRSKDNGTENSETTLVPNEPPRSRYSIDAGGLGSGGPSSPNDAAPQAPKASSLSKADIARARENLNTAGVDPGKGETGSASSASADSGAAGAAGAAPTPPVEPTLSKSQNDANRESGSLGSGSSASIAGGGDNALHDKIDKIQSALSQPTQKPSVLDRLGAVNDHIAKESAATHVSINAHVE